MTDGITATIGVRITAQDSKTPPIGGMTQQVTIADSQAYAPGAGAGLADTLFTYPINIAASGNHTINLSTDLDAFAVALGLAEVQSIYVEADATNTNNIVVGNAGSNPFVGPFDAGTDTYSLKPGGKWLMAEPSGWAVGSGVNLKLANSGSGSAVTGKLVLIGRKS